jgi:cell division septation protein DedD
MKNIFFIFLFCFTSNCFTAQSMLDEREKEEIQQIANYLMAISNEARFCIDSDVAAANIDTPLDERVLAADIYPREMEQEAYVVDHGPELSSQEKVEKDILLSRVAKPTKDDPYYHCTKEACNHKFSRKEHVKRHIAGHFKCRWGCSKCSLVFNRKDHANEHVKIHSNARPYTCDYAGCERTYRQKCSLRQHQRNHGHNYF